MIDTISVCMNFKKHCPDSKYENRNYLALYKDGLIAEVLCLYGKFMSPGVYDVIDIDSSEIYAVAEIPEVQLGDIK